VSFTSYLVKRLHRRRDGLSVYWARHSWATVAANDLGLPQDTISRALGHSFGVRVTQVYIDYDTRRVDEANRAVIDFVLGK
jgi:integrase